MIALWQRLLRNKNLRRRIPWCSRHTKTRKCQREREERGEAIAPLKREIAERMAENARLREEVTELRGQVSALLAMFGGGKAKGADIIDLIPNWRKPDAA